MHWRSRGAFWGTVVVVLALVSLPSVELFSALDDYRRFLMGWEPAPPMRASSTSFTPHGSSRRIEETALRPVEFRHKAPRAKSVEVVGDFNAWKPGLLKMSRGDDGTWNAVVPVPQGRHKYLFLVDGEPKVDAKAETTDGPEGRRVSVRMVK
jgi:hypothetical protein